jgi:hypothetical protein
MISGILSVSYAGRGCGQERLLAITALCFQNKGFRPGGLYDILVIHAVKIELKSRDFEFQSFNNTDVQIDAEAGLVIFGIIRTLDGLETASDDLRLTPLGFHRTITQVGEPTSNQLQELVVEVLRKPGEANQ